MGAFTVIGLINRLAQAIGVVRSIAIADCVHFCGYRYGRGETNPYEAFAKGLAQNVPIEEVRSCFSEYLCHYRPLNLADALGIKLGQDYPLWHLPWRRPAQVLSSSGWVDGPNQVVDVMTHFCAKGVPKISLEREFAWHERAFKSIHSMGYKPRSYGYITVREMRRDGLSRYLVVDGNHRLSVLSALGHDTAEVKILRTHSIDYGQAVRWPLVRAGMMSVHDARRVFNAYFAGNRTPNLASIAASII